MIDPLENIRQLAVNGSQEWQKVLKRIVDLNIDVSQSSPYIGESLEDFNSRVSFLYAILKDLKGASNSAAYLIPQQTVSQISSNLQNLFSQIQQIEILLSQVSATNSFGTFDYANLYLYTLNGSVVNLQPYYVNAKSYIESSLVLFSSIQGFLRVKGGLELTSAVKEYNQASTEVMEASQKAKEILEEAQKLYDFAKKEYDKIEGFLAKSQDNNEDIEIILKRSTQTESEVKQKLSDIDEILLKAKTLETSVNKMKPTLKAFDSDLEENIKKMVKITDTSLIADEENERQRKEIEKTIEKANLMINGATNIGFASSFFKTYQSYYKQSGASMWFLYFSFALLIASVIPSGMYLIQSASTSHLIDFPGILARAVLVTPALALVIFASRRYSSLFALQREYAHRSTIAQSIEGFKREAPKYEEEITFLVFKTLQENPSALHMKAERDDDNKIEERVDKIIDTIRQNLPAGIFNSTKEPK
jgi:hypothetical protein